MPLASEAVLPDSDFWVRFNTWLDNRVTQAELHIDEMCAEAEQRAEERWRGCWERLEL